MDDDDSLPWKRENFAHLHCLIGVLFTLPCVTGCPKPFSYFPGVVQISSTDGTKTLHSSSAGSISNAVMHRSYDIVEEWSHPLCTGEKKQVLHTYISLQLQHRIYVDIIRLCCSCKVQHTFCALVGSAPAYIDVHGYKSWVNILMDHSCADYSIPFLQLELG